MFKIISVDKIKQSIKLLYIDLNYSKNSKKSYEI